MSIVITSTTDTPENVAAAMSGQTSKADVEEAQEEATNLADEKTPKESVATEEPEEKESQENESEDESNDESEDESSEASNDATERPKRKSGFKRRIEKLNARISAKEQEVEYWKEQSLKGQSSKANQSQQQEVVLESSKPDPNNFETQEEYILAVADFKADEKLKAYKQEQQQERLRLDKQKAIEAHLKRAKEFESKTPDFQEVLNDVDDIPMSLTVEQAILESDNGPRLMYELAKKPEEYRRICELSPLAASRAIGRFESKLETPESKREITKTNAPKPISTVGSKASVKKSISDKDLSQADYERIRREQFAQKMG